MTKRVLVVEDDGMLLDGIREILEQTGYEVHTATNGVNGLQALQNGLRPDVIVSDLTMPKMTGFELFQHVRNDPQWASIPFIILTGRGTHHDTPPAEANGVFAFVSKPFAADHLVDVVASALHA